MTTDLRKDIEYGRGLAGPTALTPYYDSDGITIYHGDCRDVLPALDAGSVNCCVTSPPYWGLRDYGVDGQLGLEETPEEYVTNLVEVFREVRRVLRDDGTVWLNMGDTYCSAPNGNIGINDFLELLAQWDSPGTCDFDGDGVGINDFLALLAAWGPCP